MDVCIPEILSCSIKLVVVKVSWLKVSNIANVIISLSEFLCQILTDTTHMLRTSPVPIELHWTSLTLAQLFLTVFLGSSSLLLSSFFLILYPCRPVGCFARQILQFLFLHNSLLYVLVRWLHSNHSIVSAWTRKCFSPQLSCHWRLYIHPGHVLHYTSCI